MPPVIDPPRPFYHPARRGQDQREGFPAGPWVSTRLRQSPTSLARAHLGNNQTTWEALALV